jgi:tetratricopeptide (TPR) repeat protein
VDSFVVLIWFSRAHRGKNGVKYRRNLLSGALLVALLSAAPVGAQPAPKPTIEEKRQQAASLFAEAEKFYAVQEWQKALDLYKESYLLSVEPALLYNIAQCQRQLGKLEESLKSYRAFIRGAPSHPYRPNAEEFIRVLDEQIRQNGGPRPPVSQPSGANPNPAQSQPQSQGSATPPQESQARWIALAAGSGAALGGIGLGVSAFNAARDARTLQADSAQLGEVAALDRRARLLAAGSDALFVIGAAGIGYGLLAGPLSRGESLLQPKVLYGTAGAAAGLGLLAGLAAQLNAAESARLQEQPGLAQEQVAGRVTAARRLGLAADVLLLGAAGSAAGGFLLSRNPKKGATARASLSPAGLVFSLEL